MRLPDHGRPESQAVFEYATRPLFLRWFRLILLPGSPINANISPGEIL
jgi:hypothetical protein